MTIKHLGGIFGRNPTFEDVTIDGGIYIGGEASGNRLDDYEEGTWTPLYSTSGGSFATMTMDIRSATYTKIGNIVILNAHIRTDDVDITGASGSVKVSGLPFPASATMNVSIGYATGFNTHPTGGIIVSGESRISLVEKASVTGASGNLDIGDLTDGTSSNKNEIVLSATYVTTS